MGVQGLRVSGLDGLVWFRVEGLLLTGLRYMLIVRVWYVKALE